MARKSGLGRGLGALLGEAEKEVSPQDVDSEVLREVPLSQIRPNPNQPRKVFDEEELDELAASIAQNGVLQPLIVRRHDDAYQIVAGERRYQASKRAGIDAVPVVVRDVSDEELLQLALIENLQRTDLNPLEAAQGYADLMEQNDLTQEQVGEILGKSRSAIANALRLLDLPNEVRELVASGKLSAGHARAILSVKGDYERVALAHKVVDEGLSVRQTEILGPLFSVKTSATRTGRKPSPQSYKQAARKLRDNLSTKVSVRSVRGRNRIEIEFGSEEELQALVDKIIGA